MVTAVTTGGNGGLGLAQTRRFVGEGAEAHVVARSEGKLVSLEGNVHFHRVDLSDWRNADYLNEIHEQAGSIDVLVNNAGMHLKKPVWEVTADELEERLDINLKAIFSACGRYVALQRETGEPSSMSRQWGD